VFRAEGGQALLRWTGESPAAGTSYAVLISWRAARTTRLARQDHMEAVAAVGGPLT
jgi:hypothetical protein